jgi:membrane-associated phospholipid phosphatase
VRVAAKIISVVFHPLLMTTYLVLLLGIFFPQMLLIKASALKLFALLVFFVTFVLPGLNMVMFKVNGVISSLTLESRAERIVPFIFISIIYSLVTSLFFYKGSFGSNFNKLMLIVSLLVIAATLITFFYKISVHSISIWGAVGILLPLNKIVDGSLLWPTAAIIVVAGLVMSSRLFLNAHTPREILIGAVVGFSIGFCALLLLF